MLLIVLCTGAIELRAIRCAPAASAGSSIAPSASKHIARRIPKVLRSLSERNCIARLLVVESISPLTIDALYAPLVRFQSRFFNLGGQLVLTPMGRGKEKEMRAKKLADSIVHLAGVAFRQRFLRVAVVSVHCVLSAIPPETTNELLCNNAWGLRLQRKCKPRTRGLH